LSRGGEHTGSNEKGITGQKEADEQSGFGENDHTNHRHAAPFDQAAYVKEVVQKIPNEFRHAE
jgi:hypothetical protein